MNGDIAGHDFVNGRCLKCGRLWVDIRSAQPSDVGQVGFYCGGASALSLYALNEIVAHREKEDKAIENAMGYVVVTRS